MASIESRHNTKGKTYRIRLSETEHPDRSRIGLGKCTKRQANTAMLNIENLLCAKRTGDPVSPSTQDWLAELPVSTRNRLVSLGLARPRQHNDIAIGEWIDNYIESRTDIKAGTATAMKQAAKDIEGYFDKDTLISNFTEHDASSLRIKLLDRGLAESTVRRRCKYAKQFFEARQIVGCGYNEYFADSTKHESRQRIIDHWLVVDRKELLAGYLSYRVQACA